MASVGPGDRTSRPPGIEAAWLGALAAVAVCGFRIGLLPGGLVGVDLALALVGWWLATPPSPTSSPISRRWLALWQLGWPAIVGAIGLACAWVLVASSVALDGTVRGQALAAFGGYGNWHLLALGPAEAAATRLDSPLQHLWSWSVLVQLVAVWLLVGRVARPASAGSTADRRPLVLALLGGAAWLGAVAWLVVGASDQTMLLATPVRAPSFLLASALATVAGSPLGRMARTAAAGVAWPAAGLFAVLLLVAPPDQPVGRIGGSLIAPLLAVLLVAGTRPWPVGRSVGGARPSAWFVAAWFLVPPALAIAYAAADPSTLLWSAAATAGGLAIAIGPIIGYAWFVEGHPPGTEPTTIRRVIVPPATVALLVLLFSVTGAFHWEAPQPRDRWPASVWPPP